MFAMFTQISNEPKDAKKGAIKKTLWIQPLRLCLTIYFIYIYIYIIYLLDNILTPLGDLVSDRLLGVR